MIKPNYIVAYLRRHWPHCASWNIETMKAWVQWFLNHDRALLVTEKNRLVCVSFFRRLNEWEEAEENYADNPAGKLVYIEVTAASRPSAMKAAFNVLDSKLKGTATHLAWVRGKYDNRKSVFPYADAARHLSYG